MKILALPMLTLVAGMLLCSFGPLPNEGAGAGFRGRVEPWLRIESAPREARRGEVELPVAPGALPCPHPGRDPHCLMRRDTLRLNEPGRAAVHALVMVALEPLPAVA